IRPFSRPGLKGPDVSMLFLLPVESFASVDLYETTDRRFSSWLANSDVMLTPLTIGESNTFERMASIIVSCRLALAGSRLYAFSAWYTSTIGTWFVGCGEA